MGEDVDADQVGEAEGSGARPADGGAGERVDFFDGEALLEHQVGGVEHDGDADAVGDEVGRVVGEDDLLAEEAVGEGGEGGEQRGIGFGGGDEFKQAHVARRIEEVGAEEAGLRMAGNAAAICAMGRPEVLVVRSACGAEMRQDAGEQRGLDGEILGDGFDDPVALGELGQIVVEVAGSDEAASEGSKKAAGLDLARASRAATSERAARALPRLWRKVEQERRGCRRWPGERRCASPWFRRRGRRRGGRAGAWR